MKITYFTISLLTLALVGCSSEASDSQDVVSHSPSIIVPVSGEASYDSTINSSYSFALGIPKDLTILNNVLSFNEVEGATSYLLLVNDIVKLTSAQPSFYLPGVVEDGYHTLRVQAKNDNDYSYPSYGIKYFYDSNSSYYSRNELNYAYIDQKGAIYTFGDNTFGQLGHDSTTSKVDSDIKFSQVTVGVNFIVALSRNGDVYSWGGNEYGQLGREGNTISVEKIALNEKIKMISSGDFHVLALSESGALYAWGRNDLNQTGNTDDETPHLVSDIKFKFIKASSNGSLLISEDGHLYAMGNNLDKLLQIDGPSILPLTKIDDSKNYQSCVFSHYGIWAIDEAQNVSLLNSNICFEGLKIVEIQSHKTNVICKDEQNFLYRVDVTSQTLIKLSEERVVSFAIYENTLRVVNEHSLEKEITL